MDEYSSLQKEISYLVTFLHIFPGARKPLGETFVRMIGFSVITDYSVLIFLRKTLGLENSFGLISAFS